MRRLRIIQLGIDHPHGPLYRETMAHHPGFALAGGYDADPERAAMLLAREGLDLPVRGSIEDALFAFGADAALITLPNDVTPGAIVTVARHGLPILCEKPGARTAAELEPAVSAVERAGVAFLPAYLRRFSPVAMAMRDLVATGMIGELVTAQVTHVTTSATLRNAIYLAGGAIERADRLGAPEERAAPTSPHWLFDRTRSGGGIMHWLGVHWLDLLRMVTGDEVTRLSATLATRAPAPIEVEDVASVALELTGGAVATVACAYALPAGGEQVTISLQGTRGWMRWDGAGPELVVHDGAVERTLRFDSPSRPGYAGALGWTAFDRFHDAIVEERELPMGADDALRVLELLDAIHRAAGRGHRVDVATR